MTPSPTMDPGSHKLGEGKDGARNRGEDYLSASYEEHATPQHSDAPPPRSTLRVGVWETLRRIAAAALALLWLMGLITGYTMGGLIHLVLLGSLGLWFGPAVARALWRTPRKVVAAATVVALASSVLWFVPVRQLETEVEPTSPVERPVTFAGASPWLPDDTMRGFVRIDAGAVDVGSAFGSATGAGGSTRTEVSPFLIAKYEVTTLQFRECVQQGACRMSDRRALEGADDHPVRYVRADEAQAYCLWLDEQLEGSPLLQEIEFSGVSLPTEEQWQLAAAGSEGRLYPWGGSFDPVAVNAASGGRAGVIGVGRLVRGATPNRLFDMSGNVAEWTATAPGEASVKLASFADLRGAPQAPYAYGLLPRIIRGGSFYDGAGLLTTTARTVADAGAAYDFIGFRVVISRRQSLARS